MDTKVVIVVLFKHGRLDGADLVSCWKDPWVPSRARALCTETSPPLLCEGYSSPKRLAP